MVIFRAINAAWPRRMQFVAFAGLTSVSILAGSLRAEWFAFKKNPAPVESLEPRANEGFDRAIRNLLTEANRLEKKGELNQAIILTDRAAKIAEESSNLVKIAPDISPSVISEYAKTLRSKKQQIELSSKRAKTQSSNTAAIASSRLTKESSLKTRTDRSSRVNPPAAAEPAEVSVRNKKDSDTALESTLSGDPSPKKPDSRHHVASTNSATVISRSIPEFESDDLTSSSEQPAKHVTTKKTVHRVSTTVATNEEPPFDPFFEDAPQQAHKRSEIRSFSKIAAVSKEVIQAENVHTKPDPENVTLISSSSSVSEQQPYPSDSRVVKLRYRYRATEPQPNASINSKSGIRTPTTEPKVTTASIETEETSSEEEEEPCEERQEDNFSVIQVRETRQSTDFSSELDPGNPQPALTISKDESPQIGEERQLTTAKTLSPFRIRRTLKLRNSYSVLPLLTPIVARSTREPVVGRTSMIHWRPAKEASSVPTNDGVAENGIKSDSVEMEIRRMQNDVDRSIFDHVSAGIHHRSARGQEVQNAADVTAEPTVDIRSRRSDENRSIARREIHASVWDNAAAPSFEGTWRPAMQQSENQRTAPLPPKSIRIEQTAFTQPQRSVKRDLRSEMNSDLNEASSEGADSSLGSTSTTADFAETSSEDRPDQSEAWMDDVESVEAVVNRDSIQQTAGQTGLPESTVSTMLGAFGVALLIAGIWMVRATAGIKHE